MSAEKIIYNSNNDTIIIPEELFKAKDVIFNKPEQLKNEFKTKEVKLFYKHDGKVAKFAIKFEKRNCPGMYASYKYLATKEDQNVNGFQIQLNVVRHGEDIQNPEHVNFVNEINLLQVRIVTFLRKYKTSYDSATADDKAKFESYEFVAKLLNSSLNSKMSDEEVSTSIVKPFLEYPKMEQSGKKVPDLSKSKRFFPDVLFEFAKDANGKLLMGRNNIKKCKTNITDMEGKPLHYEEIEEKAGLFKSAVSFTKFYIGSHGETDYKLSLKSSVIRIAYEFKSNGLCDEVDENDMLGLKTEEKEEKTETENDSFFD